MSSFQFFPNLVDPIDFSLTARQLSIAAHPSTLADFTFIVGSANYRVSRQIARIVFTKVNDELTTNPNTAEMDLQTNDPDYFFRLIPSLLAGEVITITESNAHFLHSIGVLLGNSELAEASERFLLRRSVGAKFVTVVISLFSVLALPMRIILFLCEVVGVGIGISFLFNLALQPITAGVLSPVLSDVLKWSVMAPWIAFNVNTVTVAELLVWYICSSNHLFAELPIPRHVYLVKMFKVVWPWCTKAPGVSYSQLEFFTGEADPRGGPARVRKASFFVGDRSVWNVVQGAVFFVGLVVSLAIDNAFRYVLQVMVIYLPYLATAVVCLLYSLHTLLSLGSRMRERFVENGDFSDPFLCAFYFRGNPWFSGLETAHQAIAKRQALWSPTGVQIEEISTPSPPLWKIAANAVFSKFTIGLYMAVGLILILIVERDHFTVGQSFSVGIVIIGICMPIMTAVRFPLLCVSRWFKEPFSEAQVQMGDRWIRTPEQRDEWLDSWFVWSRQGLCLRVARILWLGYLVIWIVLGFVATAEARQPAAVATNRLPRASTGNVSLSNPVCFLRYSGLDIVALSALAESAYIGSDTDPALDSMFTGYFGADWREKINETILPVDAPWWHSTIRFFEVRTGETVARVLSIRGTLDPLDMMLDAELWAGSVFIAALKATIPLFSGYAHEAYAFLGYAMNLARYAFQRLSLLDGYVNTVLAALDNVTAGGEDVILTGHSLGGALSKIVGWIRVKQAVAFNAPGIAAIEPFYDWGEPNVPVSFVNIVPNLDPWAGLDRAAGSEFLIPCQAGALACHTIWRTQCMLAVVCGQFSDNLAVWCNATFGPDEMQKMWDLGHPV
jgi:hypothetical protein